VFGRCRATPNTIVGCLPASDKNGGQPRAVERTDTAQSARSRRSLPEPLGANGTIFTMGRAEDLFARLQEGGEQAIDELIATRQSEELFFDFKRSSDNASGVRLSTTDRNNLGKAISGFGNSEGGVIVWGVDCSQDSTGADLPRFKVPLADSARFVSWLEGAVSGTTVPPHSLVRSIPIGASFAATLVAKSDRAPHQTVQSVQYYIRAGSNFTPTPHAVLAGMFGRRPLPNVFHKFLVAPAEIRGKRINFDLGILVRNQGAWYRERPLPQYPLYRDCQWRLSDCFRTQRP